ncbi:MAG: hypothetical protein QG568_600 [Patescibacteria group bacterium]|nr:hypothetical protein [Patescibacteria group bacterium]
MHRILNELHESFRPVLPRIIHEIEEIGHLPLFEAAVEEAELEDVPIPEFTAADITFLAEVLDDSPEVKEAKKNACIAAQREEERERAIKMQSEQWREYHMAKPLPKKVQELPLPISEGESKTFFSKIKEEILKTPQSDT